jgi:asparagine synthase (glutamine-hydrolysing)
MSAICGWIGEAPPERLGELLGAVDYRGDTEARFVGEGFALGYRFWAGRPGKSPTILEEGPFVAVCAGHLAPSSPDPARELLRRLEATPPRLSDLDGAFAAAIWDRRDRSMRFVRDPFGIRSLYTAEWSGVFWFASELKQLLALPGFPVEPDPVAIHKYLTFSFVPGEDVPIRGVRRILPGRVARLAGGRLEATRWFELREEIDESLGERSVAVPLIRTLGRAAVEKRLPGEGEVGLFLSGGLDSSAVGFWLRRSGARFRAFSLDFGEKSVEKSEAALVAKRLEVPHEWVPMDGSELGPLLPDIVWKLDLPFGDPVTGPQYLLGRLARERGLAAVFSGEGGDQLFGGWTNKPMVAAELFGGIVTDESREETYLRSYHRFYGLEKELYTDDFAALTGGPGQRRAHLCPLLAGTQASTFLGRLRVADIFLKGSQNILARAERMANAFGLDARVPLFDRALAEASFRLPPRMKLSGANEKWVLKLALRKRLPDEIVWAAKRGMSVPATDWCLGPLAPLVEELLGDASLRRRGWFRPEYVARLRRGENEPHETRRRRVGERLWTLLMLEAWLRIFVDGRGSGPTRGWVR